MRLELIRDTYSRDMGTFGILSVYKDPVLIGGVDEPRMTIEPGGVVMHTLPQSVRGEKLFECHTVERPWANNTPNISCIPEGEYTMRPRRYYRGGYDTWEICDVPGRTYIMLHSANVPSELEGCVGVGSHRYFIGGEWAVESSRATLAELLLHMKEATEATLRITHILAGVLIKDGQEGWNHPPKPI